MRRHRFIISDIRLAEDVIGVRDPKIAHQMRSVLRIRPGDEVVLSDGGGSEAVATVKEYGVDSVLFAVQAPRHLDTEPPREVTVYAAVSKRDTFEWACQKATECGATRIVPIVTERTVKPNVNLVRVRAIVKEAAEQCGRAVIPEVMQPMAFTDAILEKGHDRRWIASTADGPHLADQELGTGSVAILIGPEGGFSPKEAEEARDIGWEPVSLGPRILRAETAVAIAAYLLTR